MPDDPISTTPSLGLKQYEEGSNPGADALNANWDAIDAAALPHHATDLPATFRVGGLFLVDEDQAIYRNDGTEDTPVWTSILDLLSEATLRELADEALQDNIDSALAAAEGYALALVGSEAATRSADDSAEAAARLAADSAETSARAAEDLTLLKKDGSRAMTGDLDLNSHKAAGMANGSASTDGVNKGQLDAAIAAVEGLFGVYEYCRAYASADLGAGTSPRTFEADTNSADTTDADMHSTSSNKDRFVAQQDALYLMKARFHVRGWAGCGIQWYKNGTLLDESKPADFRPAVGSDETFITDDLLVNLTAGDYVTAKVYGLVQPDSGEILATSSVQMFAMIPNAAGGGDFFADGHVPMTGDLDMGGGQILNMEDGVADTDGATVGQIATIVDAAVAAAITAEDIPGLIDDAIEAVRLLQVAEPAAPVALFDTVAAHNVFQDITGATKTFNLAYAQRVHILVDAFNIDDGSNNVSGQLRLHVTDSAAAVTTKDGPAVNGGNDVNYAPFGMQWISAVLPAGSTTVKVQVRNPTSNSRTRTQVTNFQVGYFN